MEEKYNNIFLGPVLFFTFFGSIQPPWPLVPSILVLARWELGLLMAWNIFSICTTFFVMGTDKISLLPEAPGWIYLFSQPCCAPNSPFSIPLPHPALAMGTVTMGPCIYRRILRSVSVGLLHSSHWTSGLRFLIHTYEARPPTSSMTQVTNPTGSWCHHLIRLCLCANVHTFHTAI